MINLAWRLRESDHIHQTMSVGDVFTFEEIQRIKAYASTLETSPARVGPDDSVERGITNNSIRQCQVSWLHPTNECNWVYMRLVDVIHKMNSQYFNFNLYGIQTLQYTIYNADEKGFYSIHKDARSTAESGLVRKLSFSMQLSDPTEYEGGELITEASFKPEVATKELGSITFFNSDLLHEAKPVTKGSRHVLVGWVIGPPLI